MNPVGATPRDLLDADGPLAVYHYRPAAAEVYRVPLLLVLPPTNRGYILDLAPGDSLVEFLLGRGYDVYMLDWSAPGSRDRDAGFDAYAGDFVGAAVARVCAEAGVGAVTLAGYCMGGVFAAVHAARFPAKVANLVCLTTPIDFTGFEQWQRDTDPCRFDPGKLIDADGLVASGWLYAAFDRLRPTSRLAGAIKLWEHRDDAAFVDSYRRLDRWSGDVLPLPGALFDDIIRRLMWANALFAGTLVAAGAAVDLGAITVPFLHLVAGDDRIVPAIATQPLVGRVGSIDATEVVVPGGHVMLLAGAAARTSLWPRLDRWLETRSV